MLHRPFDLNFTSELSFAQLVRWRHWSDVFLLLGNQYLYEQNSVWYHLLPYKLITHKKVFDLRAANVGVLVHVDDRSYSPSTIVTLLQSLLFGFLLEHRKRFVARFVKSQNHHVESTEKNYVWSRGYFRLNVLTTDTCRCDRSTMVKVIEGRGTTFVCLLRRTPFVGTYFTFLFWSDWYQRKVLQCKPS